MNLSHFVILILGMMVISSCDDESTDPPKMDFSEYEQSLVQSESPWASYEGEVSPGRDSYLHYYFDEGILTITEYETFNCDNGISDETDVKEEILVQTILYKFEGRDFHYATFDSPDDYTRGFSDIFFLYNDDGTQPLIRGLSVNLNGENRILYKVFDDIFDDDFYGCIVHNRVSDLREVKLKTRWE